MTEIEIFIGSHINIGPFCLDYHNLAYKKRTLLKQEMYLIKLWILITGCKFGKSTTVRPKSLVHFLYRAKLYKNGQDFLDIQYVLYV